MDKSLERDYRQMKALEPTWLETIQKLKNCAIAPTGENMVVTFQRGLKGKVIQYTFKRVRYEETINMFSFNCAQLILMDIEIIDVFQK